MLLFRRLLVCAGVLSIILMGFSAAAIAGSILETALTPHDAVLQQATEMADQAPAED